MLNKASYPDWLAVRQGNRCKGYGVSIATPSKVSLSGLDRPAWCHVTPLLVEPTCQCRYYIKAICQVIYLHLAYHRTAKISRLSDTVANSPLTSGSPIAMSCNAAQSRANKRVPSSIAKGRIRCSVTCGKGLGTPGRVKKKFGEFQVRSMVPQAV